MIAFDGKFSESDRAATFRGLGKNIFFIQVGAMDGVALDPIHPFVKEFGWRGILIEPVPDLFEKLKANYASCDGLTFINAAIADFDGEIEMTRIDPTAVEQGKFTDLALHLSTIMPDRGMMGSKQRTAEFEKALEPYKRIFNVPCFRLKTVLQENSVGHIDALIVDTEGADWMVVRQLPLEQIRPRVVYLEYNHLSAYEQTACANHFRNHGYRIYIEEPKPDNFLAVYPH